MKIFITGSTGFIGTYLVSRLSKTQHELLCLAREKSDTRFLKERGAKREGTNGRKCACTSTISASRIRLVNKENMLLNFLILKSIKDTTLLPLPLSMVHISHLNPLFFITSIGII